MLLAIKDHRQYVCQSHQVFVDSLVPCYYSRNPVHYAKYLLCPGLSHVSVSKFTLVFTPCYHCHVLLMLVGTKYNIYSTSSNGFHSLLSLSCLLDAGSWLVGTKYTIYRTPSDGFHSLLSLSCTLDVSWDQVHYI